MVKTNDNLVSAEVEGMEKKQNEAALKDKEYEEELKTENETKGELLKNSQSNDIDLQNKKNEAETKGNGQVTTNEDETKREKEPNIKRVATFHTATTSQKLAIISKQQTVTPPPATTTNARHEVLSDDSSDSSNDSSHAWRPKGPSPHEWLQQQRANGLNPRDLIDQMMFPGAFSFLNNAAILRLVAGMCSEPPRRQKLNDVNTFADVVRLVREAKKIIVLTGAGVSVSCGIPDFRSSNGIYAHLAQEYPDLPDPTAMFDINYFRKDPRPFYKFAREIYPGQFQPSPCHRFVKLLEKKQKLLRNYTQNIDTLEKASGIENVIECHGSFSTASCTKCNYKCESDDIRDDIFAQRIPVCPLCQPDVQQSLNASEPVLEDKLRQLVANGIMKPDIVFFGEGLPGEFHEVMTQDKDKCDLLIVMGSSLKVRPVAFIPSAIPAQIPQILINREQLHHLEFDVELLGDADVIINQLCHSLGDDWKNEICCNTEMLKESTELIAHDVQMKSACIGDNSRGVVNGDENAHQQLQDTDTQSVKSNGSAEAMLRSVGMCSDSGFESSSSAGVGGSNGNASNVETDKNQFRKFGGGHKQEIKKQPQQQVAVPQVLSLADRLIAGTYYYSPGGYSYIFPGAQVTFSDDECDFDEKVLNEEALECEKHKNDCEEEEEDDDDEDEIDEDESDNEEYEDDDDSSFDEDASGRITPESPAFEPVGSDSCDTTKYLKRYSLVDEKDDDPLLTTAATFENTIKGKINKDEANNACAAIAKKREAPIANACEPSKRARLSSEQEPNDSEETSDVVAKQLEADVKQPTSSILQ